MRGGRVKWGRGQRSVVGGQFDDYKQLTRNLATILLFTILLENRFLMIYLTTTLPALIAFTGLEIWDQPNATAAWADDG
jgi:hypothetical protein